MPDSAGVSVWIWVAVAGAVLVVLGAGGFVLYRFGSRRAVRRYVVGMIARRENLEASSRALDTVVKHLAEADDETLMRFATDSASEDRRTFHEVEQRMTLLRDELDHMRLPARVIPLAEQLADSAHIIAVEAGRLADDMTPDAALDALGSVDLSAVAGQLAETHSVLEAARKEYDIEETAVYGGGLYI